MTFTDFDEIPRRHYRALVIDPPWKFKSHTALQSENWDSRRDAEKRYAVMSLPDIMAMPVKSLASAEGCHLFLCTTSPFVEQSLDVMRAWGFKFSCVAFTWAKLKKPTTQPRPLAEEFHSGLGLTTRKNCECVLLGRRGNCRRIAKDVRDLILAQRREHSRKPDEIFARIERYCAGPYIDLFSREKRDGWDSWGEEVDKFDAGA